MVIRQQEQVGRVLAGRYRILTPIGTGASAHVFLADDVTLRRRVAVKVLHAGLANDPNFLRRFQSEAQAVAALNHPNIVHVFDWGETEDGPFVVLEYLDGGSLRDLLDTGFRLSPSQALLLGLEAARALDYAHRRGLVHRDIKPANLLFDDEARLRVGDFGIARALAEAAWTEPSGSMLGTARYAAPEQVQGSTIDGKADVFSLALVLIECVTGSVPFSADTTIATLMARVNSALEVPAEMGPLSLAITRATVINPAERVDAAAFADLLNAAASELSAPEKLPIVGTRMGEQSTVIDRDPTIMGRPRVADFDSAYSGSKYAAGENNVFSPTVIDDLSIHPETLTERMRMRAADRRRIQLVPRKGANFILLIALVLAAVVMGMLCLGPQLRPTHDVPALVNKPLSDARTAVRPLDFHIIINSQQYADQPLGYVLSQKPDRGTLHEGEDIGVVISKGPAPRPVPDLSSKSETDAANALGESGFSMKRIGRRDETVPKGFVLDWSPRGDQPKGSEISVVVSDGPALRTVPDVAGKGKDDASAAVQAAGFTVTFADAYSDTVDTGKVISTSPTSGAQAEKNSAVTITVSKGPETIAVPNVIGLSAINAANQLQTVGFQIGAVYGPPGKIVFSSDPTAGTKVKRGSLINLYTR